MFSNILFVNVYNENRAYGGPEEGGWYFDTGELIKVLGPFTGEDRREKANRALARVEKVLEGWNEGAYPPGSVLCSGYYTVRVSRNMGESFPQERPRYE